MSATSTISDNTFGSGLNLCVRTHSTTTDENGKKVTQGKSEIQIKQPGVQEKESSLDNWVAENRLPAQLVQALVELGAEGVEDLVDLDDEDIASLNLKKLQVRRFTRAINALREQE